MSKELDKLVKKAYEALQDAMNYADENNEEFDFSPAYGMGGYYYPKLRYTKEEALELLRSTKPLTDEERKHIAIVLNSEERYGDSGWVSSSNNC